MSLPSFDFAPEFFIDETATRTFRVGFIVPASKDFRVRVKYADAILPETGVVEVSVLPAERQEGGPQVFTVQLTLSEGGTPVPIGTLTYVGEATIDDEVALAAEELTGIVQQAFFCALRGGQALRQAPMSVAATTMAAPVPAAAKNERPGSWRSRFSLTGMKLVGGSVALVAVGLIAYGVWQVQKPQDPIQQALAGEGYKDLQEKIRQQFAKAASKGDGAFGSLQGQNVAIDTLRSMGLDPGKANTGCLVGVK